MSNFTQNNQNGDNIMNFGSQPRQLNRQTEEQLNNLIVPGSTVGVTSVLGDGEAYNFAVQVKSYLEQKGYEVKGVNQAVYSKPIKGQEIHPPKNGDNTYQIIIGNKE